MRRLIACLTGLLLWSVAALGANPVFDSLTVNGPITGGAITSTGPNNLGGGGTLSGNWSVPSLTLNLQSWTTTDRPVLSNTQYGMGYNTTLGRFEFWNGTAWQQHVRLSGDTMTGALHMGGNLLDGSNVNFTGGTLSGAFSGTPAITLNLSTVTATGGSGSRTLQDVLAGCETNSTHCSIFDMENFGVSLANTGQQNRDAIQNKLTAVCAAGGRAILFLPASGGGPPLPVDTTNGEISISCYGVTIAGRGPAATQINWTNPNGTNLFHWLPASGQVNVQGGALYNLRIWETTANSPSGAALLLDRTDTFDIDHVRIANAYRGVECASCTWTTATNLLIEGDNNAPGSAMRYVHRACLFTTCINPSSNRWIAAEYDGGSSGAGETYSYAIEITDADGDENLGGHAFRGGLASVWLQPEAANAQLTGVVFTGFTTDQGGYYGTIPTVKAGAITLAELQGWASGDDSFSLTAVNPGNSNGSIPISDTSNVLTGDKVTSSAFAGAIAAVTWSSNVVTVTTTTPTGFVLGHTYSVTLAGETPSGYNGTFTVTATGTNAFTYAFGTNPGTETVHGTWSPNPIVSAVAPDISITLAYQNGDPFDASAVTGTTNLAFSTALLKDGNISYKGGAIEDGDHKGLLITDSHTQNDTFDTTWTNNWEEAAYVQQGFNISVTGTFSHNSASGQNYSQVTWTGGVNHGKTVGASFPIATGTRSNYDIAVFGGAHYTFGLNHFGGDYLIAPIHADMTVANDVNMLDYVAGELVAFGNPIPASNVTGCGSPTPAPSAGSNDAGGSIIIPTGATGCTIQLVGSYNSGTPNCPWSSSSLLPSYSFTQPAANKLSWTFTALTAPVTIQWGCRSTAQTDWKP